MRTVTALTVPALAFAAACGGPEAPAPRPALAYAAGTEATYTFADTMRFAIEAGGMGDLEIDVAYRGTARIELAAGAGGLAATVDVLTFQGGFSNPMAGSVSADASDIDGPVRLRLSPRGETEIVELPSVTQAFEQVAGMEEIVRDLFVRLPGTPLDVGGTWTDTIRGREEDGETLTIRRSILTATVTADTTLAGRTLKVVETSYENTLNLSGTSGGTRISQRLSGTTTGTFLWDPDRALLVARREDGAMSGTLSLPEMGIDGLPVDATLARRVRLEP